MPTTTYTIALDKNGDGFTNIYAQPSDPPNLLPTPVTLIGLPRQLEGVLNRVIGVGDDLPYGVFYLDVQIVVTSATAYYIGTNNFASGTINTIAVTSATTYTAVCWLRGASNYAGAPMRLSVYSQTKAQIATATIALTGDWAQFSLTFTPGAGVTHICLALEKLASGGGIEYHAAGFMVVTGSSAPANFNAGDDLNDAITSDVLAMDWRIGLAKPYDSTAAPTLGKLTMRNEDRRNSPTLPIGVGQNPLLPGRKIRIAARRDGVLYTLLDAIIDRVEPAPGSLGARTTLVHLASADQELANTHVLAPLLTSANADDVISVILSLGVLPKFPTALEAGVSVFAYVADTWSDGIPALTAIKQVTEAERGRFFTDRRGRLVFYNRHHLRGAISPVAAYDENMEALGYVFGRDLINQVRVRVRPRGVGSAGSVIWQSDSAQLIKPSTLNSRTITARLRAIDDRTIGALTVITPVSGTDYSANTLPDGSGTNVTASVTMTVVSIAGSAVTLQLTNNTAANAYLLAGARLRGTPLLQSDPFLVEWQDSASISAYGIHPLAFDLPYLVTIEEADQLARDELRRRKNPFGAVTSLSLSDRQHPTAILARTLFDRITVKDTQARHESDYFIIAEEHTIDLGGESHRVNWLLEPANPGDAWQLGRSKLGQTTKLSIKY